MTIRRRTAGKRDAGGRPERKAATEPRSKRWSVYIVRRSDGALYTGIALDVERRFAQHVEGKGAKALRGRGPLELVLQRAIGSRGAALRVEHDVKRLSKAEKEWLLGQPRWPLQ